MGFIKKLKPPRAIRAAVGRAIEPLQSAIDRNPTIAAGIAGIALPGVLGSVLGAGATASAGTAVGVAGEAVALSNPEVAVKVADAAPLALAAAGLVAGPGGSAVGGAAGSAIQRIFRAVTSPPPIPVQPALAAPPPNKNDAVPLVALAAALVVL